MVNNQPLIIAHRGASAYAPENTLAAFKLAVEQGSDGIELDVQLSKDGQLMVIHDETITRTTNGTGKVRDLTAAQLQQYDAGKWFNKKYTGERIPLLSEVFNLVPETMFINIEIKNLPHPYEGIEKKLLELVTQYNRIDNVVVSSFDFQSLRTLINLNDKVKIGLLYYQKVFDHVGIAKLFGDRVYSLHPDYRTLNEGDISKIKAAGYEVFPWTVNSIKAMKSLIYNDVSGIITNYPPKMKRLLPKR
ncbi:glycerophosphodiester phosphodiesterase [Bacillus sp. Marseille-P3661]|uniref:glycerophosphodiester phosphodiesterase n=1 Tax=Bacillus sp. Marseille-P3661 TaxID=1936234 RepID=UPI000C83DFB5|nr:glycerophosphodiester phosphodiesterase [Bacillus sp. Marseille-P3661]